ncbi:C-5 sterol desaturase [Pseudohyphozyma bogoriensis]|nr:C-5 sterol desaturase [Pseudohyphozyma bogoriensis]
MDIALHYFDEYIGDALIYASNVLPSSITDHLSRLSFPSTLPRDNVVRQSISIYLITYLGAVTLYFTFSTFSYYFIFDHRMKEHPRFLPSQVRQEILCSLAGFPLMDLLMVPFFLGDVRGYSKLYDTMAEGPWGSEGGWKPWAYVVVCTIVFLVFTDFCIYWIHRWLHIPVLYKRFHKPHHKWIVPTPFAAYAFHPVDGFLQGVPYHLACYIFPMHKLHWVGMFVLVNLWTVFTIPT